MAICSYKILLATLLALQVSPAVAQQVEVSGGKIAGLAMADGSTIF